MKRKYLVTALILAMVMGFAMVGTGVVAAMGIASNQLTYTTVVADTSLSVSSTYNLGDAESGAAYQFTVTIDNDTVKTYNNVQPRIQVLRSGIAEGDVTLQCKVEGVWQPCTAVVASGILQYDCPATIASIAPSGSQVIQYKITYNTAGSYTVKILALEDYP